MKSLTVASIYSVHCDITAVSYNNLIRLATLALTIFTTYLTCAFH
jgi:hypothetical protein